MKASRIKSSLAIIISAAFFAACGGGGDSAPGSTGSPTTPTAPPTNPETGINSLELNTVMQPDVAMIPDSELSNITVSMDNDGAERAQITVPSSMNLEVGQVFVANQAAFKVINASTMGDQTTLTLVLPELEEVFESVQLSGVTSIDQMDFYAAPGVTLVSDVSTQRQSNTPTNNVKPTNLNATRTLVYEIDRPGLQGTVTIVLNGNLDTNIDFSVTSGFERADLTFTGTATLSTETSFNGSFTLDEIKIGTFCSPPVGPVFLPAAVCQSIRLAFSTEGSVEPSVRFQGRAQLMATVALPGTGVENSASFDASSERQGLALNPGEIAECTTVRASVRPGLISDASVNLLKIFTLASLQSTDTLQANYQTRLDPRSEQRQFVSSYGVDITNAVDGLIGSKDNISATQQLIEFLPLPEYVAEKIKEDLNNLPMYTVNLSTTNATLLPAEPLPACITSAEGAITPEGQEVAFMVEPSSTSSPFSPPTTQQVNIVLPNGNQQTFNDTATAIVKVPTAGTINLTLQESTPSGESVTSMQQMIFMPSGTYIGSAAGTTGGGCGSPSGPFQSSVTAMLNPSGVISAVVASTGETASGQVAADGSLRISGTTSINTVFSGQIVPGNGFWSMQGNYRNQCGGSGSFDLRR